MAVNESCEPYITMFEKINEYFRNEIVLEGAEHSSKELGYLIAFAYSIVIVFGALGNFLTILVVVLNPNMRTTRNYFILNLALSDFFVCTVTAPITLYTVLYVFWPFGTMMCKVAGSLQGFNIFLSTFSIAAIALDRYVLVIFPTKRERQRKLSLLFFCLIWLISLILAIPLLIASDLKDIYVDPDCRIDIRICHEQNEIWEQMLISKRTYTLALLATQYAFPLSSIVFAYTKIVNRMRLRFANRNQCPATVVSTNSERRRSVVERRRRTHLLLVFVVIIFALAWLPLNVFHLVNTFEWVAQFSVSTFAMCHVAAMCSACLNPVIYAFFNHNFRAEFMNLFDRVGLRSFRRIFGDDNEKERRVSMRCGRSTGGRTALSTQKQNMEESVALHLDTDEQL